MSFQNKSIDNEIYFEPKPPKHSTITANITGQEVANISEGASTTCDKENDVSKDFLHVFM